jgi:glycosyltransferase involved in cell wall biosynthesis
MYLSKTIAVVIPAYNEESQIGKTLATMPGFVDYAVVVDDCSRDKCVEVVKALGAQAAHPLEIMPSSTARNTPRILLITHQKNQGVGSAIVSGYQWCVTNSIDIAVVMAGDGQMDPADLPSILTPIANEEADYCKGNRLFTGEAWKIIPRVRYLGNSMLSLFTKIASGYWHVADSQSGYTAVSLAALNKIPFASLYRRYGYPNHLLVMLNIYNMRVRDVPVRPVYNQGEQSKLRLHSAIPRISMLLLRQFLWRIKEKYIVRDFHPLVFFYFMSFLLGCASIVFLVRLIWLWIDMGFAPSMTALALGFCLVTGFQSAFFAMWFDMDYNKFLK